MKALKKVVVYIINFLQSLWVQLVYVLELRHITRAPSNRQCAVILHLYYPEMWTVINESLLRLRATINFDLYISIPRSKKKEISDFNFGDAYVFFTPNKGRDVLPFMKLLKILLVRNYVYILKLHSKKSPQRSQGEKWSNELINKLIPDQKTQRELIALLEQPNCGLIGPQGNYLPLSVYSTDNAKHIIRALRKIYDSDTALYVYQNKDKYGFFAGTMFWARLDIFEPIVKENFAVHNFALERGQLDGTFAHALERVFCILPQLKERELYEVSSHSVKPRAYIARRTQESWDKSAANKAVESPLS